MSPKKTIVSRDTAPTKERATHLFDKYKEEHPKTKLSPQDFYEPVKEKKKSPETKPSKTPSTSAPKGGFFADKAKNAPDVAAQKITDPTKLFAQAKETHEKQLDWLNRGKGLDSVLGATVIRGDKGDKGGADYLDKKGPVILIGPLKKMDRSKEKVMGPYGGDWSQLGDIVRASIAVDSFDDIGSVVTALEKSGITLAEKPNDRFSTPTEAGYRDLALKVKYENGHVGELQIHLKSIIKAKEEGHKYYEKTRSIAASAKKEGRDTLTDDEQKAIDEANNKMKDLYSKAWESATKTKSSSSSASKVAASIKYYRYEGFASQWEYKKFPLVHWTKGPSTQYELEDFFNGAVPISKSEFEKLKDKRSKKSSDASLSVRVAKLWLSQ